MLQGLFYIVGVAFRKIALYPKRQRNYERQTKPFLHRTRDGLTFELAPNEYVDRHIILEGIYERRFLTYLRTVLKPGGVMLDIGANIGNHAIFLAEHFDRICCFEPNPGVADRLFRNVALNALSRKISVHRFGLGDKNETLAFVEVEGNLGASHFISEDVPGAKHLEVRQAAQAVEKLGITRVDYIKIDVEGMEESVLTALKPIIQRHRPIVSFEHHGHQASEGTFGRIRQVFVDYRFVYPFFAPSSGSASQRLLWNLRHDGGPVLEEITEPRCQTYENILAIPNQP